MACRDYGGCKELWVPRDPANQTTDPDDYVATGNCAFCGAALNTPTEEDRWRVTCECGEVMDQSDLGGDRG